MPLENEVKQLIKFKKEFLKNLLETEMYDYEIKIIIDQTLEKFIDPANEENKIP